MDAADIDFLLSEADRLCELERYDEAFLLDLKAAKAGDVRAQTHLGWYYENGLGTDANPDKAFEWYSRAASQGHADAQYCLGVCHEEGIGTPINADESLRLYRLAAAQEQVDAIEALIRLKKATEDSDAAVVRTHSSTFEGNAEEQYNIAQSLGNGSPDYLKWLREAANGGYAPAMTDYGLEIEDSNPSEAMVWFLRASDSDYPRAFYCIAYLYDYGLGVDEDKRRAFEFYRRAYEKGYPDAAVGIALAYETGDGTGRNEFEAARHMTIAVDLGVPQAYYELGRMMDSGIGNLPRDISEIIDLYEKAIAEDIPDAMTAMAKLLLSGTEVE